MVGRGSDPEVKKRRTGEGKRLDADQVNLYKTRSEGWVPIMVPRGDDSKVPCGKNHLGRQALTQVCSWRMYWEWRWGSASEAQRFKGWREERSTLRGGGGSIRSGRECRRKPLVEIRKRIN